MPPQMDADMPMGLPNWRPLFDAAGLDIAAFTTSSPEWTPHSFADTRAAWAGHYPERPDVPIRVEASAYHGRPVSFMIVGPWTRG